MAYIRCSGNIGGSLKVRTASGNPCSFSTNLADTLVSLKAAIVATGGNGTPSTPIPIVGHSELNLVRCGVNLWDEQAELGLLNSDGTITEGGTRYVTSFIPVVAGIEYAVHIPFNGRGRGAFYDANKNFISYYSDFPKSGESIFPNNGAIYGSGSDYYFTLIPPTGACYLIYNVVNGYGSDHISFNFPSTDTSYHAYNGTPYLVSFGQTVYGGEYDANRGKVMKTFDDSNLSDITGWSYANGFFRTPEFASIIKKPISESRATNALCSIYNSVSWHDCGDNDFEFAFNPSTGELIIKDSRYTDVPSFLAGVSGISLVYELATPIEIDVSSISVEAVSGVNNIVSDGGGDVEAKYLYKA